MSSLRLYNDLHKALSLGDFEQAKELAASLERVLEGSMSTYGWDKLPLSGRLDVDTMLLHLDPYLTGDRK